MMRVSPDCFTSTYNPNPEGESTLFYLTFADATGRDRERVDATGRDRDKVDATGRELMLQRMC